MQLKCIKCNSFLDTQPRFVDSDEVFADGALVCTDGGSFGAVEQL